jgi:hypothetical protein
MGPDMLFRCEETAPMDFKSKISSTLDSKQEGKTTIYMSATLEKALDEYRQLFTQGEVHFERML